MLSPDTIPFKAKPPEAELRALSGFSLLACSGPDAGSFLQAQTMNDVRALAPGRWQWNGWLNPKGRLICLFALWQRAEHDYLALLPDFPAAELQPLLQRYVFRSKLRLQVEQATVVAGSLAAASRELAAPRDLVRPFDGGCCFDFGGEQMQRSLWLLPADSAKLATDAALDAAWRLADLAHGLPRLDASQREAWTPQMLSLQRLGAFSLSKGCYPGQEIVARTHYLGQAKRELARLCGAGLQPGTTVSAGDGRALGTVVSASHDGTEALAVLSAERGEGPWLAGGVEVRAAPLLDGLQRPA
jgi:folate-binding protein YgfZ